MYTRICTLRYRAPECLLTDGFYNYKMDMWGVGCVMFEVCTPHTSHIMRHASRAKSHASLLTTPVSRLTPQVLSLYPLFPGTNELDQIHKIHNVIGTPPPGELAVHCSTLQHIATHIATMQPPIQSY